MIAAEAAIRAWVNGQAQLVGPGNPLALGAFLLQQRSPSGGAYAVLFRSSAGSDARVFAEDDAVVRARVVATVYHPQQDLAEAAATALATAWDRLKGSPEVCGDTGVTIHAAANLTGPAYMPTPADSGEPYSFQLSADFILSAS